MIDLDDFKVIQESSTIRRKLYKSYCDECGKDKGYQRKKRAIKPNCKICSSSMEHKGKVVSKETKQRMSDNHWTTNGITKHHMLGKTHSEETKIKISKATTEQNRKYGGKIEYNGINGIIGMRSGWEVKYAKYLDGQSIGWKYEPDPFLLSTGRLYLPDFQLSTGVIIEVKGYWWGDSKEKWDLFCLEYPEIDKQVLMKNDLQQLGIL